MALKKLYFSKFSWGACPRTPLEVLAPLARVGQIRVPPPKFLSPYAYGYSWQMASMPEEADSDDGLEELNTSTQPLSLNFCPFM